MIDNLILDFVGFHYRSTQPTFIAPFKVCKSSIFYDYKIQHSIDQVVCDNSTKNSRKHNLSDLEIILSYSGSIL